MNRIGWWVARAVLTVPGLLNPGLASAAHITITDDDVNGVVVTPDANFEGGVTVTQNSFESASLSGDWLANMGRSGSGIIYLVEPGTTILSDILDATWSITADNNPPDADQVHIDLNFESDVNGVLLSGRTIPQLFLDHSWYTEETGSLQGMTGLFRDPNTGANVNLPTNLTIVAASDIDPIPEPSTLVLLGMGLAGFAVVGRKRLLA
jgi:hypothetical protein